MPKNKVIDSDIDGADNFDLSKELDDLLASFSPNSSTKPKQKYSGADLDHRKHHRHPVRWRVAIVDKVGDNHNVYHGRTHSVSLSGISILLERNVHFSSEVVVLLAIPPMHHGDKETIVEIQCRLTHTVLDSVHGKFRLGMKTIGYKRDGKKVLSNILSKRHIPKQEEDNPYQIGH